MWGISRASPGSLTLRGGGFQPLAYDRDRPGEGPFVRQWAAERPTRGGGARSPGGSPIPRPDREAAAEPVHADDGPAVRKRAVLKVERRARALQQCLGDEEAQPQAARLAVTALAATAGDVGLADPVHDLRGKARTVIGDGDGDVLAAQGGGDLDPLV